ncbi:MAG: beta-ketoacyl-ACP synthase III [Clostridiaceae bacterium]
MKKAKISGVGCYYPDNIVTNDDLAKIVDTSDEWIHKRTGIRKRRLSTGENTSDLAVMAAKNAIKNAGLIPEDIDLIVLATTSPDFLTPSTAAIVQGRIGAKNAACFDILAACSGFIYGLKIVKSFIESGAYKKVLIIGAEVLSKILDWNDRNTCVLFGDGAGAAVFEAAEESGIETVNIGTYGDKADLLICKSHPLNNPYYKEDMDTFGKISMDGREVYKFATNIIPEQVNLILKENNLKIEDIKYIIPHQANLRIIETAAKKLNVSMDKFYVNLNEYGNTSAACIPICMDEMNRHGLLNNGDKIITVAFGGGLTFGAALIIWSK